MHHTVSKKSQKAFILSVFCALFSAACSGENPPPEPADLAHLEPPPTGQGFQMQTGELDVKPGDEVQNCYFFKVSDLAAEGGLPAGQVHLHRVQIAQTTGSHHMNVFRVRTVLGLDPAKGAVQEGLNGVGECFKSPNWADWPLVANSQQDGKLDWTFPDGVANTFEPDEWLMVQSHFVNADTQKTAGVSSVRINFWTIPKEDVVHEMGTVFATKQSVRVCASNPEPSFSGTCGFNSASDVHIIGANGHFHSRGKQFDMYVWDGLSPVTPPESERFYVSQAWDDPPMKISPELDRTVPANGGVFYTCNYGWTQPPPSVGGCSKLDEFDQTKYGTATENLDCCYTFGPIVETNEHCNIFVYYYPKQDNVNCF